MGRWIAVKRLRARHHRASRPPVTTALSTTTLPASRPLAQMAVILLAVVGLLLMHTVLAGPSAAAPASEQARHSSAATHHELASNSADANGIPSSPCSDCHHEIMTSCMPTPSKVGGANAVVERVDPYSAVIVATTNTCGRPHMAPHSPPSLNELSISRT